jgi:hypothetical protein
MGNSLPNKQGLDAGPSRIESWQSGYAVRRDWPDGAHDFFGFRPTFDPAEEEASRSRRFWRPGPIRPVHSVVTISRRDFDLHAKARRNCCAQDCPAAWGSFAA